MNLWPRLAHLVKWNACEAVSAWREDAICPSCKEPMSDSPLCDLPRHGACEIECARCGVLSMVKARASIVYCVGPCQPTTTA